MINVLDDESVKQIQEARAYVKCVLENYWVLVTGGTKPIRILSSFLGNANLDLHEQKECKALEVASSISKLSLLEASFRIGEINT